MSLNSAASVLRRALLYGKLTLLNPNRASPDYHVVPSSSPKFLEKSRGLKVDTVAYDLEDSVTLGNKEMARKNIVDFLGGKRPKDVGELAVRINSVSSGLALQDLTQVLQSRHLDTLVVPKVNSASDLHFINDILRHSLPTRHPSTPSPDSNPVKILALIESAQSILNLSQICAASPYLHGLIFAAEDFSLDLNITRTPSLDEFLYARSHIATCARAFNLASTIDLVCTSYRGEEGQKRLQEESLQGKGLGFNGKQCIHPSQVEIVQKAFAPGEQEVEWSVRVVIADEKADRGGRGAWTLDGKMIDMPVVGKAKEVVKRAELCGFDIEGLKEKWKEQEPE
ncbi:aldolase citrate lyase family protein [Rutstroemia sp. NJR-2017a WRK4]|nr:aldolase citrate lyase family protein [Rutstroemia sp. NJR-2017a WRK4]